MEAIIVDPIDKITAKVYFINKFVKNNEVYGLGFVLDWMVEFYEISEDNGKSK